MFGTIELVSESTELMFESFEHRFIHKKQGKFIINRRHFKCFVINSSFTSGLKYGLKAQKPIEAARPERHKSSTP